MITLYPLEELFRIRKIRVDESRVTVVRVTHELESALTVLYRKKKELEEYEKWRVSEEERLFINIKRKILSMRQLESYRNKIAAMREKELLYREEICRAETEVENVRQRLEKAKEVLKRVIREKEKIEAHKERWMEEARKEEERQQDLELEDFVKHQRPEYEEESDLGFQCC